MKRSYLVVFSLTIFIFFGCFEDQDDNLIAASEINDFVWKGMNFIYAYKDNIPDLANDRFSTNEEYNNYLNGFASPEEIFSSLIYLPNDVDEFSVIFPNYIELEQLLQGTTLNNGMEFGLVRYPTNPQNVFGYVRYVLPNTSAENENVERGMIFNAVDNVQLTDQNFGSLLFGSNTTYTINLAMYNDNGTPETSDDTIDPIEDEITLTKTPYTENPILLHKVIEEGNSKIGYLMYNGFRIGDSNLTELNNVFAEFSSEGISDLVLDLRYNGGGSVSTAIWLSSMITGQFTGEIMFEENWNSEIQAFFDSENPELTINRFEDEMIKTDTNGNITFQESINSLGLNKLYVISTGSTASSSELVINSLDPYIDIVQIGTSTVGKPQASRTIYDSDDLGREGANPAHTYAMQPLIYEAANAAGVSNYYDGLGPTQGFFQPEQYGNLGVLGNTSEPLLARAIADITGTGRTFFSPSLETLSVIPEERLKRSLQLEMTDNRQKGFRP